MLSIKDAPLGINGGGWGGWGGAVGELPIWLGSEVLNDIHQLKQDSREKGNSLENGQILIEAISKNKSTTVAQEGEGKICSCAIMKGHRTSTQKAVLFPEVDIGMYVFRNH